MKGELPISPGSRISYHLRTWDENILNGQNDSRTGIYLPNVPLLPKGKLELWRGLASSHSQSTNRKWRTKISTNAQAS